MRKLKSIVAYVLALGMFAGVAWAAEGVDVIRSQIPGTDVKKITVAWTAAADGSKADVVVTSVNAYLFYVVTDPGATAPAADYEIVMTDDTGLDVMDSSTTMMADLSATATEDWTPKLYQGNVYGARFIDGDLTLAFTDTANADCEGEVFLYVIDP